MSDPPSGKDNDRGAPGPVEAVREGRAHPGDVGARPVAAATVVLLRPGPDGLEVLLTRRPATMVFAPDIHVFPGGRVDPGDGLPDHPLAGGLTPERAAQRLAGTLPPLEAFAHHVAAVRETLEETGIRVAALDLVPLSRWVTPPSLARRFDVRFFAVQVPAGTEVVLASSEVSSVQWVMPGLALEAARVGALALLAPTLVTLEQLAACADMTAVSDAFRPGPAMSPPTIGPSDRGVSKIDQRWAGGIAGRAAPGWLVGERELVLVNPADPTGVTSAVVDEVITARGAKLVGIALTGLRPQQHAGVELYAAGRGLPVVAGQGAARMAPYPVVELEAGDTVPYGDLTLTSVAPPIPADGALDYLVRGDRRLPPDGFESAPVD